MEAQLTKLVGRLEAVTTRLESVASSSPTTGSGATSMDSGEVPQSVTVFDSIVSGPFAHFVATSQKIGGDVKTQVEMVKDAFTAQRDLLVKSTKCKKPADAALPNVLKPMSEKIAAVQEFRESHRRSQFFNHLSAVSESIPALGWVAVSPTPGPFVKEMMEAGQFFSNRVLKDFKEKDVTHVDWVKSWNATFTELQSYIKQYHTTGVTWNPQGCDVSQAGGAPASAGGAPPPPPGPPPPPVMDLPPMTGGGASETDVARSALFADISRGEEVTKGLRKVTDDMKTHKNPALRTGPQPFKPNLAPKPGSAPKPGPAPPKTDKSKPAKCALEGKKWVVEYQNGNRNIVIGETEMKQTVYIYKCENSTIQVIGKVNALTMDSCKKSALVFDEAISSLDFINCQSVQSQILVSVPTVSIDKTDGCMIYLSKDSLETQIVTAKSSEMNILVPDKTGEFKEFAIPEQFRTHWNGKKLVTEVSDMNFSG